MILKKGILIVIFFTVIALFYVNQQINIVITSYKLAGNKVKLEYLIDKNKNLEYNINRLNSPSHICSVLNKDLDKIKFNLAKNVRVKKVTYNLNKDLELKQMADARKDVNLFYLLFGIGAKAEAKSVVSSR